MILTQRTPRAHRLLPLFIFLFIAIGVISLFSPKSVFAETANIISPTESQSISGVFEAEVDWTSLGASATCAYVYNDWNPTVFSGTGWNEVNCELAGSDIPAPNTDGEHTLRVAAWLGAGFTSNATSDYVTFTYASALEYSGAGAGTELDPYVITTCTQLQEMNNFLDADFVLGNDIDCEETEGWNVNLAEWEEGDTDNPLIPDQYVGVINNGYYGFEPIGQDDAANNSGSGFTGTFDGQQNTISNLWIFRKENDFNGLFGYATNATIKNFTLDNPRVVGAAYTGSFVGRGTGVILENLENNEGMVRAYLEYYGGGIAGYLENASTATGLFVIDGAVHGSGNTIGGLVGLINNSSVSDGTSSADVDGGEYIGGAFGVIQNNSTVSDVDASGNVVSNDADDLYSTGFSKNGRYTGGFAGSIDDSVVQNSTATGLVTADQGYVGGFAGKITNASTVSDSSATGYVSGGDYVGGFAGTVESSSDIYDSTATGGVESAGLFTGGFVGESSCGSTFLRVSASGNVQSDGDYAGGFVGGDGCEGPGSTFTQAAAHGNVTSTGQYVGGFVGNSSVSTFINSYASGDVTGTDRVGGFGGSMSFGDVSNVYSRGLVVGGDLPEYVGGFIGFAEDMDITASFIDNDIALQVSDCGDGICTGVTALSTADAKTSTTYTGAGWDFENIWGMNSDNDGYPHFFWESFGPLLGSGTSEDPYQMTQCFDATESGYYELQNNITGVIGTCITIEADDVFIDGDNHTISGSDGEYAIFSEGYDSISISNITLETFVDGIRLLNAQGTSIITDVTILDMEDDGMELRGVSGMTISDSTITGMSDDGTAVRSYYDDANDTSVYNIDLVIQNLVISDTEDFGMDLEYVTGLLVTENEIFNTEDDGINAYSIEDAEILNNSIYDVDSDGIYIEDGVNVLISENTITNVDGADGIDVDYDYESSDITITDNVLTNIYDNGIEIGGLGGGTVTGNTIVSSDGGVSVSESENIDFSDNTITPTISEFIQIPTVATEFIALDILDADNSLSDYGSFDYMLPFTFNFQGRDITDIHINTNGSIDLLEDGESCQICSNYGNYEDFLINDSIFASFDGLTVASADGDYVAVFSPNDEYVVVEWRGTTQYDNNSELYPIHFQVVLYPDGEVQWNFIEINFQAYYYDLFTGAYDVEAEELYRAGLAINEPSSYRADFSGDTNYELTESYDPITGIELSDVTDSSFIGNSIHADRWIYTGSIESVVFNDSDSGNTYRLLNGEGAWTMFDIVDTDGNGYAESGSDRPFSESTLGDTYWAGEGEDVYPASLTVSAVTPTVTRSRSGSSRRRSSGSVRSDASNKNDDDTRGNKNEDDDRSEAAQSSTGAPVSRTPVTTTRELQRFLNTNGFPIAPSGPGSLNNETDIFGALTRQALIKFQQANGITPALGIFGPITRAFINGLAVQLASPAAAPTTPPAATTGRDLELGATGADVTQLQQTLIKAGFPITSGATGYFGRQTKDALSAYQKANNIAPVSGYFGQQTRVHMKKAGLL
jgi:parallel beta-helix repeat protein